MHRKALCIKAMFLLILNGVHMSIICHVIGVARMKNSIPLCIVEELLYLQVGRDDIPSTLLTRQDLICKEI